MSNSRLSCSVGIAALALALAGWPGLSSAQLKINEVYYNVSPQGGNQFVELLNTAVTNVFLDGMILTDEAGFGTEGVFRFPGTPGGTTLPVAPGGRVVIAVDAFGNTAAAGWECYAGGADFDNPAVSNLTLVSGVDDLGLSTGGDNCLLASGTDTIAPIDSATVVDGMNYLDGGGELAPIAADLADQAPHAAAGALQSLGRCLDGADGTYGTAGDFVAAALSPAAPNVCLLPLISVADTSSAEGNSATNLMSFLVTLSQASTQQVTVSASTTNGTATAGEDYLPLDGLVVVFDAGATSAVVNVPVIGDYLVEGDEMVFLRLYAPTNGTITSGYAQGTILADDGLPGGFTSIVTRISGSATAITSVWITVPGRAYQLQSGPTLINPIWTDLGTVITAVGATASAVDTSVGIATQRFYRVIQLD